MNLSSRHPNITLHLAQAENAFELAEFHNRYYGAQKTPEHWLWKYHTYLPDNAVFVVARDSGKIIGTQGVIPLYMKIGTMALLAGKSEDSLLLPEYRGIGLLKDLYKFAVRSSVDRGIQFLWGFSGAVQTFTNIGYTTLNGNLFLSRPGNIWVGLRSKLRAKTSLAHRIGAMGKLIYSFGQSYQKYPHVGEKSDYEVIKGYCDEQALEKLYARIRSEYGNIASVAYDQRYLEWRVRKHPFLAYDEYQVYCGGKLKAYAIVAFCDGNISLSDLTSEDRDATSLLLSAILKDNYRRTGDFSFFGSTHDVLAQDLFIQLNQFGFKVNEEWTFGFMGISEIQKNLLQTANWHINGLWTEGFYM